MNLQALFETQAKLDADILAKHPVQEGEDRLSKKILALQVELGECANEWRGFKFWSNRQSPVEPEYNWKPSADGQELVAEHNDYKSYPLLEEYVDCLHFILSIGIEHEFDKDYPGLAIEPITLSTIEEQFTLLMRSDWEIYESGSGSYYTEGLELFLGLGRMLGFAQLEILKAYYTKNETNHQRQRDGY
jgi:dimeric dUTPase (all-alpha-NTP-PPase superfamily)